jgi:two-component system, chemotaxis family, chemotaxis protein CheY
MSLNQAMPILVAEDSEAAALIVRMLLWRAGFKNVDTAPDGLAALVKMSEKKYDLVIADWQMEPMSGYELLKQIRGDAQFAATRVIIMAAEPKTEQVVAAKKAGANNYIGKPFTKEALKAKIAAAFLAFSHSA